MTSDFYCDEVLSRRTPVDVVREDEVVLAFHHTRPAYRDAHLVVIPKAHITDLRSVDGDTLSRLLAVVQELAGRIVDEHGACRVVTNLGRYQDSKHLHWHLVSGDRTPPAHDS